MPTFRPNGRPSDRRWQARVQHNKRRVSLGFFATENEAALAEEEYREENGLQDWSRRVRHDLRSSAHE